ncbi:hypothetical protein AY599_08490 [Leptolyngbya valderiana BDU 20041]|nr:hypothetical protein AY599_08490 [Leptolyngbya valderiana BDU 20041]
MANLPGISIGRPNESCAATGEPLHPGDRIVSVLLVEPGEGSHRMDVREQAWLEGWRPQKDETAVGDVLAVWRGVVPAPKDKAEARPVDDEDLVALFDQIAEPEDEQAVELRYVLAWMLIRRRRLRLEGQRKGQLRVRRVTATGAYIDAEPIEVADPGLDEDQLEQAMERVAVLLLGETQPPTAADANTTAQAQHTGESA